MKYFLLPVSLFLLTVTSGCLSSLIGSSTKVTVYDISTTPAESFKIPVKIEPFTSESPVHLKMLCHSENRIERDEFNQWIQPPSALMHRFFTTAFASDIPGKPWSLSGHILSFERYRKTAVLDVIYKVSSSDGTVQYVHRVRTTVPLKDLKQKTFADAMQQAALIQQKEIQRFLEKVCKPSK